MSPDAPVTGSPEKDLALLRLLGALREQGYRFVTPGNPTLRIVRARPAKRRAADLRDVFGWNLPFSEDILPPSFIDLMRRGDILTPEPDGWRSSLRVSSLGDALLLHSGYPTSAQDAVFFGPDTYRYAAFLKARIGALPMGALVVDVGAGAGAGGIAAARLRPEATIVMTDINQAALRLARINALASGVSCQLRLGDGLEPVSEPIDLVIANPPFIAGQDGHTYRDGGDGYGSAVAEAWALSAMAKLAPGGRLLLYTGAPIVDGVDVLYERLKTSAPDHDCSVDYEEIDPDIFSSELRRDVYAAVDRIAAIGAVIRKRSSAD